MPRWTRHDWLLAALLAVAAAIRLVFLLEIARTDLVAVHLLDADTYHTWALRLVAGDPGWEETYWMGPLYPHLLALVYWLFGPDGVAAQAIQLLMTVLNVLLVHRLALALLRAGDRAAAAPNVALGAATVYAFYGAPVYYAGYLLMTTLVTTLMLLVARQALRALLMPTPRHWLGLGLLVGLTGLARGNVLLLVATLPLLLLGRDGLGKAARLRLAALLAAGALAMVVPVTVRNVLIAHDFTLLTSNGGVNLLIGQQPHGEGAFTAAVERPQAEHDPSLEMSLEWELGRDLKGSEISRILADRAWQTFRDNLGAMPRLYLLKTWRFWSGYELPQIDAFIWWRHQFLGLKLLPVPYLVLSALGLAGLAFLPRRTRPVLLILVFSYFLSLLPFFPTSRYRQPIAPLLAISAATWVVAMIGARAGWPAWTSRRPRVVSALVAAALLAVLWPTWTALPAEKIVWQVKLHESSRAAKLGDLRTTLARAREAEEARPGLAETSYLVARHLEDLEAWPEAGAAIAQAAVRDPRNRLVQYRVGRVAENAGRLEEALAAYAHASAVSPDWAYPWLRRGLVLRRLERVDEALAAMREAYARSPGNRRIRANLGSLLAETGHIDESRAVLTALVGDYPVYVNGWFNLALLELQAGDRAAARAAADRAAGLHTLSADERAQVARLRQAIERAG